VNELNNVPSGQLKQMIRSTILPRHPRGLMVLVRHYESQPNKANSLGRQKAALVTRFCGDNIPYYGPDPPVTIEQIKRE
jgi:hypothetical protein